MKILFVSRNQYGYLIDSFFLSKYLAATNDVTYLGMDHGYTKNSSTGVEVISVQQNGSKVKRYIVFAIKSIRLLRKREFDIRTVQYFPGCSILRLFTPGRRIVLDIRTCSIDKRRNRRAFLNLLIHIEAAFFKYVTVISLPVSKKLRLSKKAVILPVGSTTISDGRKKFDSLSLIYVGTLFNRDIDKTLEGLSIFLRDYNRSIPLKYIIIGSGIRDEVSKLKSIVELSGLSDYVSIEGYIQFEKLKPYFDQSNIGVSFIPQTEYYDVQPPTKSFDYLLSGMAVIATSTEANLQIVNDENGILINDTPEAFCEGLKQMCEKMIYMDSDRIRATVKDNTWENISSSFEKFVSGIIEQERE